VRSPLKHLRHAKQSKRKRRNDPFSSANTPDEVLRKPDDLLRNGHGGSVNRARLLLRTFACPHKEKSEHFLVNTEGLRRAETARRRVRFSTRIERGKVAEDWTVNSAGYKAPQGRKQVEDTDKRHEWKRGGGSLNNKKK